MTSHPKVPPLIRLRDSLVQRGASLAPCVSGNATTLVRGSLAPKVADPAVVERVGPMCELLFLMLQADGGCSAEERQVLRGVARTLSDGALSNAQIDELFQRFDVLLSEHGATERMYEVTSTLSLDKVVAESAYTLAATMMTAEHDAVPAELALLAQIAENLGISKRRVQELVLAPPSSR